MEPKDVLEGVTGALELVVVTLQEPTLAVEGVMHLALMQYVREVVEVHLPAPVEVTVLVDARGVLAALALVKGVKVVLALVKGAKVVLVLVKVDVKGVPVAPADVKDAPAVLEGVTDVEDAGVPAHIVVQVVVMVVALAVLELVEAVAVVVKVVALAIVTLDAQQLHNKMHTILYQTSQQLFMLVK